MQYRLMHYKGSYVRVIIALRRDSDDLKAFTVKRWRHRSVRGRIIYAGPLYLAVFYNKRGYLK